MSAPAERRQRRRPPAQAWLLDAALPIWWERAADRQGGGYFDRLNLDGTGRRASEASCACRPRQAYVYALAAGLRLERPGPSRRAKVDVLTQVMAHRCDDGLFRTRPDEPPPRDGMGLVYDQAFVLLALAADQAAFGERGQERHALAVIRDIAAFAHPLGGYGEAPGLAEPLFGNPNMHLFECAQAWMRAGGGDDWNRLAADLASFARARLIDPASGAIPERYAEDWRGRSRRPTVSSGQDTSTNGPFCCSTGRASPPKSAQRRCG